MPITLEHREQYRQWLLDRDLHPDVAAAIIETMPPFDWSEIARRSDLAELESRLDKRFEVLENRIDGRLDGMDGRLDGIDGRLDGIDGRLDGMDGRLDSLTDRVGKVEDGLDKVAERLDSMTMRLDSLTQTFGTFASQTHITLFMGFGAVFVAIAMSVLTSQLA